MRTISDQKKYELDMKRMQKIICKKERLKEKQKHIKKCVVILTIILIFAELGFLIEKESLRLILSSILAPLAIGVMMGYFNFDSIIVERYTDYEKELYDIGKQYFTLDDIIKVEDEEIIKEFSKTINEDE